MNPWYPSYSGIPTTAIAAWATATKSVVYYYNY